ncbi:MAG: hypothetical protein ABJP02_17805 [Parasphingorhabdus sp.]|uniref:hypothetical protein n=1 Tax=Parasphingorhabdus sp. TaxID=2709688 RepID=UPI0032987169
MMRLVGILVATCLTLITKPALAWDGAVTAKIKQIDLVPLNGNYPFRVYLENVSTVCSGGPDWAYLNPTDPNYQAVVSALMLAYSSRQTVIVYSNLDPASSDVMF